MEGASSDRAPIWNLILDDDPTGTQGVAGVPVVIHPTASAFRWAVEQGDACYVLTNTRAMSEPAAREVIERAVRQGLVAARRAGRRVRFTSRGDSTLRGHFPSEVRAVIDASDEAYRGVLLVPAFPEAGRLTIDGVQSVRVGARRIPVAETEFARDPTFGYSQSRLTEWAKARVPEHWEVRELPSPVFDQGPAALKRFLIDAAPPRGRTAEELPGLLVTEGRLAKRFLDDRRRMVVICPHIRGLEDLRLLASAQAAAELEGYAYLAQAGPSYARSLAQADAAAPARISAHDRGLVVVGSHTDLTNRQLEHAARTHSLLRVELSAPRLLSDEREAEIRRAAALAGEGLRSATVVLSTSRDVITGEDAAQSLRLANAVALGLNEAVRRALLSRPSFLIAKGGITSHDLVAHVLRWDTATVTGPLVDRTLPVWTAGRRRRGHHHGADPLYVVFPGNVGAPDLLSRALDALGVGRREEATIEGIPI